MARRRRSLAIVACALIGFVAVLAVRSRPVSPQTRLPRRYQLAALIDRQRKETSDLQRQVQDLRKQVDALRAASNNNRASSEGLEQQIAKIGTVAGLDGMKGPGLKVTLDDSTLGKSPSGNVNDLVIHSQDVQAAVNALWSSGAEAVAINGQRVVSTSAVLCVGNTLLLNGSVYSPPYEITAVGAAQDRFEGDALVKRLHHDADAFGLRFSVTASDSLKVPAFSGVTVPKYAKVNP
jgi:uncharacterized protein YlxW (UPF0749 family)